MRGARVFIRAVPVVALLDTALEQRVTTVGRQATIRATIALFTVPVVASLEAFEAAVAAARDGAVGVTADAGIRRVTRVAQLAPSPHDAVAAAREVAAAQAPVGLVCISVVARLTHVDDAVAAGVHAHHARRHERRSPTPEGEDHQRECAPHLGHANPRARRMLRLREGE